MAEAGMFATTDLVPLLAERGVQLSREQVYRLVAQVPERLSLQTLAALCDILGCTPSDLVEPYRAERTRTSRRATTSAPTAGGRTSSMNAVGATAARCAAAPPSFYAAPTTRFRPSLRRYSTPSRAPMPRAAR